jgi:uncharacterized surface protein with fasciclin (FAS1) repeats
MKWMSEPIHVRRIIMPFRRSGGAAVAAALVGLLVGAGACTAGGNGNPSPPSTPPPSSVEPSGGSGVEEPFGSACPNLPDGGAGSLVDLSNRDWITALGNIPALAQLSVTVALAGLGNDVTGMQQATIFAPTDSAFRDLGVVRGRQLLTNPSQAADVVRYHVVPVRLAPDALAGSHPTLTGQTIEVTGTGEDFTVDGKAKIICGNLQTQNATLYHVDQVLQPS